MQSVWKQIVDIGPHMVVSLLIFAAFWVSAVLCKNIMMRVGKSRNKNRKYVFGLIGQLIKFVLIIIGAITALGTMGVDIAALVAGLGLTGFAVGFALKDSLANFLAGLMIMIYQPFRRDDHIVVSGHEGKVISIDLRYTTLEGMGTHILIPNSSMLTNVVTVNQQ